MKHFVEFLVLITLLLFCKSVGAQVLKGSVVDRTTRLALNQTEVFNLSTKERTSTNNRGEFSINTQLNQILVFSQPGYVPDTLLIVNLKPIRRYLNAMPHQLSTVEISMQAFNPEVQYADVYREAKAVNLNINQPLEFYPSRYFSKKGKSARKLKRRLENEKSERQIDARFNEAAVTALTPLKGAELDYFMVLYRPSLKELDKMDNGVLKFYLMDSYKKFKALPAEEKRFPSLKIKSP